jgi:hypothetical protein
MTARTLSRRLARLTQRRTNAAPAGIVLIDPSPAELAAAMARHKAVVILPDNGREPAPCAK